MLKKKIIPVFLASVLTVSGTTGFVSEAFSENVYAAEEVHTERTEARNTGMIFFISISFVLPKKSAVRQGTKQP